MLFRNLPTTCFTRSSLFLSLSRKLSHDDQIKFEKIIGELNLKNGDLSGLTVQSMSTQPGSSSLLKKYKSIYGILTGIYPEQHWKLLKMKHLPNNFWQNKENHRKILDEIGEELGISTLEEWNKVTTNQIKKLNAARILKFYPSFFDVLKDNFPEFSWKLTEREILPRNINEENKLKFCSEIKSQTNDENKKKLVKKFKKKFKENPLESSEELQIYKRRNWNSLQTQRTYVENLLEKLSISKTELGKLKKIHFRENNARKLMKKYENMYELISKLFPEIKINCLDKKFIAPEGYWSLENQKKFILEIETLYKLNSRFDWLFKVKNWNFHSINFSYFKKKYKHPLELINILFPERNWKFPIDFTNLQEQKETFNYLISEHKLFTKKDWNQISKEKLQRNPSGKELLKHYPSIYSLLRSLSTDLIWDFNDKAFPQGYWEEEENVRSYLIFLQNELGFENSFEKWYSVKVTKSLLTKFPPLSNLIKTHSSLPELLLKFFPGYNWNLFDFRPIPAKYFRKIDFQKQFFANIYQISNFKSINELIALKNEQIIKYGGRYLLSRIYKNRNALFSNLFPEIIQIESKKKPRNFWRNEDNIQQFINNFKKKYEIKTEAEWYRISTQQIKFEGGGGLLTKFTNLPGLLRYLYPTFRWNIEQLNDASKRSNQRWLFLQIEKLFPSYEIFEDFLHSNIRNSGLSVEFDIFIPELNIAFEYHGEQHYNELMAFGSIELYQARDLEKARICKKVAIQLIEIPYTWDNTKEQLIAFIKAYEKKNSIQILTEIENDLV